MEIKINKEIRNYKETIFFGLSLRQFICSVSAVGVAVMLYILLHDILGREVISWFCIIGALPIAVAGFFQYNGLTFERFVWAWIKSEILYAGNRGWKTENYYYELLKANDSQEHKKPYILRKRRRIRDERDKINAADRT